MEAGEDELFYLTEATLEADEDEDDEQAYQEVTIDSASSSDQEEDWDAIIKRVKDKKSQNQSLSDSTSTALEATVTQRSEVVDDFVRNFLLRMGMLRTLNCFQTEWYEMAQTGRLRQSADNPSLPDVYSQNRQLDKEVEILKAEMEGFKEAANIAKNKYVKMKKERDYHRMHHRQTLQEKNKLITDIKRLRKHYASYEPAMQQLKQKYETVTREKMLARLERDKAITELNNLQSTLASLRPLSYNNDRLQTVSVSNAIPVTPTQDSSRVDIVTTTKPEEPQPPITNNKPVEPQSVNEVLVSSIGKTKKDFTFPHNQANPYLSQNLPICAHLTRTGGFKMTQSFQAHDCAVSRLSYHPTKPLVVTCSDDHKWKLWNLPSCELLMTGEGHKDWLGDADFHNSGLYLATCSGDGTVKIWDFTKNQCMLTLSEHIQPVWGCSWHSVANILASASMDHTIRIWDVISKRCVLTLRGHADSVNSVQFLPYSSVLCTCSADRTVSLWDCRTGLCCHTFYGHEHSCNYATVNLKGDTIASGDSFGHACLWDIRGHSEPKATAQFGSCAINQLTFDASRTLLAVASNDGSIKMHMIDNQKTDCIDGHNDAVQTVLFDQRGTMMISGSSDGKVAIWE